MLCTGVIFINVDVDAAFERMGRGPATEIMAEHVPDVARVFDTWHSGQATDLWRDAAGNVEEVHSTRGFDQGNPLWLRPPTQWAIKKLYSPSSTT